MQLDGNPKGEFAFKAKRSTIESIAGKGPLQERTR